MDVHLAVSSYIQAMVTPPSSESEKRRRKVPDLELLSFSSACRRPMKPKMDPSFQGWRRCSRVTCNHKLLGLNYILQYLLIN